MSQSKNIRVDELNALAAAWQAITRPCTCAIDSYHAWSRMPVEFPEQQMHVLGTLVEDPYQEAPWDEYHPKATNYWSEDAPIAINYFPYNRCSIWQCTICTRCCLHYTEAGGYYVEQRIRVLNPALIVDVP